MIKPPTAAVHPHTVVATHGSRIDPYFWLRDDSRSAPAVLDYLRAENAYTDAFMAPHRSFEEALYTEIVARIKQDESSVPLRLRGYWYSSRYSVGLDYPIHVRRRDVAGAAEEILLDCNELAQAHEYYQVTSYSASPNNELLAYAEDVVGRRQCRIRFKDLRAGTWLEDVIENVEPDLAWADDNRTLLYVAKDPITLLGIRVCKHVIGTPVSADITIYEEADDSFSVSVARSKSERYICIGSESTVSSEWRYAAAADPALDFSLFLARERDHEYQIEHVDERWIVRTNWQAKNFRIVETPLALHDDRERWRDVIAHDLQVFIHGYEVMNRFLVVSERSGGLRKLRAKRWDDSNESHLSFDEPSYSAHLGANSEIDSDVLRFTYSSLTTPTETYDLNLLTGERQLLKRETVLGDFDRSRYTTEFLWVAARDGERIPVSLVYRKDIVRDGSAPLYQYAYGAYGHSSDPIFSSTRLSLIDRGFVYAIAHVRGGQEMGRRWYDSGRLLNKRNTFTDFIDVTTYLVAQGIAAKDKVFASGGSAGGLLVGAVANMAPEKYRAIVAHVPFVDVVTTMLDESIPLTTLEYDEWGNPNQRDYYEYMLSYSPYDNVRSQAYPAFWITTGLWDSQVQYYEPAKWVAKLRATKTDDNPLLLRTNMEAGHGGKSGRFERYREIAEEYAFVLATVDR